MSSVFVSKKRSTSSLWEICGGSRTSACRGRQERLQEVEKKKKGCSTPSVTLPSCFKLNNGLCDWLNYRGIYEWRRAPLQQRCWTRCTKDLTFGCKIFGAISIMVDSALISHTSTLHNTFIFNQYQIWGRSLTERRRKHTSYWSPYWPVVSFKLAVKLDKKSLWETWENQNKSHLQKKNAINDEIYKTCHELNRMREEIKRTFGVNQANELCSANGVNLGKK